VLEVPGSASGAAAQTVTLSAPARLHCSAIRGTVEQRTQGTLILPGVAPLDGAATRSEMIALSSQSAPGIARADDPQVIAFFDQNSGGPRPSAKGAPHVRIGPLGTGARFFRRVE
jgi:hypothetical protein